MSKVQVNEHGFWVERDPHGQVWAGQLDWPTSMLGMTDDEKKEVEEARAKGHFPVGVEPVTTPPVIWKYPLQIVDEQAIEVPRGAKFLSVQLQDGTLCLWALVSATNPKEKIRVVVAGTGNPLPVSLPPFIGTVKVQGVQGLTNAGMKRSVSLVWHVFAGEAS